MLLATWNLHLGLELDGILEQLPRLPRPDLMAVQEASVHSRRPDSELIAERLGPSYRASQATAQNLRGRPQANGLVWDSRCFTLAQMQVVSLPVPDGPLMGMLRPSQRNVVIAEGNLLTGTSLRVHIVHLDVLGIAHKRAQFQAVLDDVRGRPPVDLAVIAGDLNTFGVRGRPAWTSLHTMAGRAGFEDVTTSIAWTQRAFGVRQKLDAVMLSPTGLRSRAWTEMISASDHLPVFVETHLN